MRYFPVFCLLFCIALIGCGPAPDQSDSARAQFTPIDLEAATFWDRQTTDNADLLHAITDEYNASHGGLPVKIVQTGNYGDIYRKVTASIHARTLPAMAASYGAMTLEYAKAGAVASFDAFIRHPETGLSRDELADFFPAVLEANRYEALNGEMYSFPFTKSVLVLFYNKRVLAKAGIDGPPATWDAFLAQCRAIKAATGNAAWAIDIDASTINAMIFSMGGEVFAGEETQFDSQPAQRTFALLQTLARENLAYPIPPRTFNDETALAQDTIAFCFRPSSNRPYIEQLMDDTDAWGIAPIPQADPENPHTILYGANISIFNTSEEQKAAAWGFVKAFTSRDTSVRWSIGTGYLPIRKSAADHPDMKRFWAQHPRNRVAFDCLSFAKSEPNRLGWQEVRGLIEKTATALLAGITDAPQAGADLKREADAILARR